ncbi:decaprenyl-phosphate phosphoribosyltransferase [Patescibacteria group bacterium]|nr:decaprenyl-phosphate phosphoribosyltransferase [Patescibacteria group bacterium]
MKPNLIYLLLKTARPRQWIKNFALYAALIFSGFFFYAPTNEWPYFFTVTFAVLIFCLLTSAVYIINDIIDIEADRVHPFKRKRPLASGQLSIRAAGITVVMLLGLVIWLSLYLQPFFRVTIAAYFMLQILYATVTKNIPILDVLSIAAGFLLRIYAGAVVVNLHMSVWFLLTVISASLFLAVGKRQSERTLLTGKNLPESTLEPPVKGLGKTRKTLKNYSQRLLDQYTAMFANSTWLTYALFAFQRDSIRPEGGLLEVYTLLPRTLQSEKLLMLTVPLVIFGVMRYLLLIYEDNQGESPETVLLRDKPLLTTAFLFGIVTLVVLYVVG